MANSRFTESSHLVFFFLGSVQWKYREQNDLQTLAFPAYFSVLTKGKGDFIACLFPLPYSVKR